MGYKFGDVFDCIQTTIGHNVIILGINEKKNKMLSEIITSRTYRAFDELCSFFNNNCVGKKCVKECFERNFKKQKITSVSLSSVFFLDKNIYSPKLTKNSMIIVNKAPRTDDIKTFNYWKRNGLARYVFSLSKEDIYRLFTHIRTSKYVSIEDSKFIRKSFNLVKNKKSKI